jgi:hypothetical protein
VVSIIFIIAAITARSDPFAVVEGRGSSAFGAVAATQEQGGRISCREGTREMVCDDYLRTYYVCCDNESERNSNSRIMTRYKDSWNWK